MSSQCVHSCKGLCNALEVAEHREKEAIRQYREFASGCDYPDVRLLLEELIHDRERGLNLLKEKREFLMVKFHALDDIRDSFA